MIEFVWVEKEMESEYGLETLIQDKLLPHDCAITGCDGEYGRIRLLFVRSRRTIIFSVWTGLLTF